MIEETIARRYAKALIDIGKDDGKFEDYGKELSEFKTLIDDNRDLRIFLENPMFETSKRLAVTEDLVKKMQLSPISGNFILLLVQKKRISYLPDILVEYQRQIDVISNIARASITSSLRRRITFRCVSSSFSVTATESAGEAICPWGPAQEYRKIMKKQNSIIR